MLKLWPITHIYAICSLQNEQVKHIPQAFPYLQGPLHFINTLLFMLPLVALTVVTYWIDPLQDQLSQTKDFYCLWWIRIVVRDLIIMLVLVGGWDVLIYRTSIRERMRPLKFNQSYPESHHLWRQISLSISTTLMGSILEIISLHLKASGKNQYFTTEIWSSAGILWVLLTPFWRTSHFYWMHRSLHPWRTKYIPDIGKVLYKYIHSYHHLSHNPSPWSAISMHPVQGFLYETAAIVPCFFMHHPSIVPLIKFHLTLLAIMGHDGHDSPGGGSYMHYLHHKHFEVNYGSEYFPFDYIFGTFCASSQEYKKNQSK